MEKEQHIHILRSQAAALQVLADRLAAGEQDSDAVTGITLLQMANLADGLCQAMAYIDKAARAINSASDAAPELQQEILRIQEDMSCLMIRLRLTICLTE